VLDSVRKAVGHAFPVNFAARRPGDIVVSVAGAERIGRTLAWTPELDNLDAIVGHALAWERRLMAMAHVHGREAISA
jgi:UDP-glucose 4-epimerase